MCLLGQGMLTTDDISTADNDLDLDKYSSKLLAGISHGEDFTHAGATYLLFSQLLNVSTEFTFLVSIDTLLYSGMVWGNMNSRTAHTVY